MLAVGFERWSCLLVFAGNAAAIGLYETASFSLRQPE